jgi:7-keto-8-aminopelargonate synthetase-like enzyme
MEQFKSEDVMKVVNGIDALIQEAREFVELGTKYGFANPQSMSCGAYQGKYTVVNGIDTIDLTRLDYLSLGTNEVVKKIMKDCIDRNNISCPTSRMALRSESDVRLDKALADFHGMADSVTFLSGYSTNENIIQALALRMKTSHLAPYVRETKMGLSTKDIPTEFFVDEESHHSLINTIKSIRVKLKDKCIYHRFPTADYKRLVEQLDLSYKARGDNSIRIIVSDTVSSMSGRLYDVMALCEIAEEYDCLLYLDEAHAVGTVGDNGKGVASELSEFEKFKDRLIIMGTLTKAMSQLGGYVAVSDENLSCFFRGCSPHYIFSAPVSPWMAEVIIQILKMVKGNYGKAERKRLAEVSSHMREGLLKEGFDILGSNSQIVPVLMGEESVGIKTKEFLEKHGFTSSLFMCPAVPKGESILRFSLCSDITCDEMDEVLGLLVKARRVFGF